MKIELNDCNGNSIVTLFGKEAFLFLKAQFPDEEEISDDKKPWKVEIFLNDNTFQYTDDSSKNGTLFWSNEFRLTEDFKDSKTDEQKIKTIKEIIKIGKESTST